MNDVLVLCYHAVSPTWPAPLSVMPDRFRSQLHTLADRGYRGTTFSDAVTGRARGRRVAVTFDDGYRSVLEAAAPILDELGWPGTVYVPTDLISDGGPMQWPGIDEWMGTEHEPELLPLSWDQLRGLDERGWEVGSHTRTHPHLTTLDDDALVDELVESRRACERELGRCASIAYPYGDVDRRVIAAASEAGYETGAGLPAGRHVRSLLSWPRVGVYHGDDRRFRHKASRVARGLQSSAVGGAVRSVAQWRSRQQQPTVR
ncbi:MAG TPA: polysaccharide deacetylase family protein [Solirubrobacteraceae bacterium]|jgi:peptidoglycan/xylan/chitin deacetylase (PgdA/CDA1 family)